jgi:hypothetical protein
MRSCLLFCYNSRFRWLYSDNHSNSLISRKNFAIYSGSSDLALDPSIIEARSPKIVKKISVYGLENTRFDKRLAHGFTQAVPTRLNISP